jgi:hypothetical protein
MIATDYIDQVINCVKATNLVEKGFLNKYKARGKL